MPFTVIQNISAQAGSTVFLPCKWSNLSIQTPHIEWHTDRGIVFERMGNDSLQGVGYVGRVDIPLDALLKGNCSLMLKNVSFQDAAIYRSSMVMKHTSEMVLLQKLNLSVTGEFISVSDERICMQRLNLIF